MNIVNILLTLLFGAVAGWLAGFFVVKDKGGLIWNIIIGILGGFVGGWLLGLIGANGSSGPSGMARSSAPSLAPWSFSGSGT